MADFTALKTAIQNAIKQNGNEEITGNLLQEVLLAIVTTLGDGSISDLITALGSEATTRQQADDTLQQNINAEAQARQQADDTLQQNINAEAQARQQGDSTLQGGINTAMQAINAINNAIGNGCVYAGIATPSTTPAAGKVFYLALTAGTYTNFNGLEVSQGINILKNNGSTWSLDSFVGIDDAPTPSSQKLVKSGGVFDEVMKNGSAFDLSAYNGGATYSDLNAALTALNALPAAYKRGGMSMKFVLSSDNKYKHFNLITEDFTTDVTKWQGVDETHLVNPKEGDYTNADDSRLLSQKLINVDLKEDNVGLEENVNYKNGVYLNSGNGKIYSSNGYTTIIINIENYERVRFSGIVTNDENNILGYCFSTQDTQPSFDVTGSGTAEFTILNYYDYDASLANPKEKEYIVDIPEGVKWFACALRNTILSISNFYVYKQNGSRALSESDIVNNVTEGGTKKALSAEQGKILKNNIEKCVEDLVLGDEPNDQVNIIDNNGNCLAIISKDGIKTLNFDSSIITPSGNRGEITIENSDSITILGSSFGETENFPINKHWSGIISMLTDYKIQNLSQGGANIVNTLYYIRSGQWDIKGRYVVITNNENIGDLDITQFIEGLHNLCVTLKGMGKIPILCTNYHKSQFLSTAILKYAYEHNLKFWDASQYCATLISGIDTDFDDGAHLRKRNAPMVAYAYLNYLHQMGKPLTSIKVFDIRDNSFSGSLDELVYADIIERSKKFKEIRISSSQSLDEYNKLINKTSVSFREYGLIECVLPALSGNIKSLKLIIDTDGTNVKVFVKNTIVSPYPNTSQNSVIRFSVDNTINIPSEGDVYSFGGVDYTVMMVVMGENNYYCTIYCTPNTLPASQSGTLSVVSQVSGSIGSSNIAFVMAEETTLGIDSFIESDNTAHWIEIDGQNNNYNIPSNLFNGTIEIDKIAFLIKSNEVSKTFKLKDINVKYDVYRLKDKQPDNEFIWSENDYLNSQELIEEPTFGDIGTILTHWVDNNGTPIVSVSDYGNVYPSSAKSIVTVSDILAMNTSILQTTLSEVGNLWLEVYCRYFPSAPTPYSQADDTVVNNDSYDFNTLYIKAAPTSDFSGQQLTIMKEEIGLMWKIVRIPIRWFINGFTPQRNLYLSLYSNNKGIEIAKVSLKYEQ